MSEEISKKWEIIAGDLNSIKLGNTYKSNISTLLNSFNDLQIDTQSKINAKSPSITTNFKIQEEIARGGMGAIFRGEQLSLRREIAIKKLLEDKKTDVVEQKQRFISEAMITAYLNHPNIVPVYELEISDDEILLAMKLVKGVSWRSLLKPENKEEQQRAEKYQLKEHLDILVDVCNAVAFAHSKGIAHCDLKPANIMIGEFGEVLVMDWGIAVDVAKTPNVNRFALHKSEIRTPMGTPAYFAPELAQGIGEEIGPWTDVYLLGAMLYEILMGKPPHSGKNILATIFAMMEGKIPDIIRPIPKELEKICTKALTCEYENRYQSVKEFQKDLQDYLLHRESLIISDEAEKTLNKCETIFAGECENDSKISTIQRNRLYNRFAEVVAGFQQSQKLWENNPVAKEGEQRARFGYAKAAIYNTDFGLAETQMGEIKNPENITILRQEAKKARDRELHEKAIRGISQMCRPATVIISIIMILLAFGVITASPQQIFSVALFWLICFLSSTIVHPPIAKKFSVTSIFNYISCFEIVGAFLLAHAFLQLEFILELNTLGKAMQTTGIFISAIWIVLFRIEIPYTPLRAGITGFLSSSVAMLALWLVTPNIPNLAFHFALQHYGLSFMGIINVARIAHVHYAKDLDIPNSN